jgi:Protein of unknown function (DUF1071)
MTDNHFARLSAINVSEHIERKGGFAYLSWPFAVAQLRLADPTASWEVRRFNDLPYLMTDTGVFVEVAVTVQGITLSQIHPVLDGRNRPILAPTCFDINTSIQRALVKAIALHGLGLYIYAGEDLPQIGTEPAANDEGKNAGAAPTEPTKLPASPTGSRGTSPALPAMSLGKTITLAQQVTIRKLAVEVGVELPRVLEYFGVRDLAEIAVSDYLRVVRSLEQRRAA